MAVIQAECLIASPRGLYEPGGEGTFQMNACWLLTFIGC